MARSCPPTKTWTGLPREAASVKLSMNADRSGRRAPGRGAGLTPLTTTGLHGRGPARVTFTVGFGASVTTVAYIPAES